MDKVKAFWERFSTKNQIDSKKGYKESFYFFDGTEKSANYLLELVLQGKKRATTSCFLAYKRGEELPRSGDLAIVTSFEGTPYLVIETTLVTVLPFNEVIYGIAKKEGEDDNLASWRDNHRRCFEDEGEELGYDFKDSTLIVFEEFKVVYEENKITITKK